MYKVIEDLIALGRKLRLTPRDRGRRALKVWLVGGLTGVGTSLSFNLVAYALTTDLFGSSGNLSGGEFLVAFVAPALMAVLVARATRLRIGILLVVANLTLVIPVLGTSFGASGSEPLWQFAVIGLVGGLFWSIPFALWEMDNRRVSKGF